MRVAIGGKNLKDIAVGGGNELENGNVEGTAAEIVDGNFAALFFVKAVGERGGGGLVDEPQNFEATAAALRSEEHTSELQSPFNLVSRLLLQKTKIYQSN